MVGGFGSVPVSKTASFKGKFLIGYMAARLPDITTIGAVNGNRFWVKQCTNSAMSFAYQMGAGFEFGLGNKHLLYTGIDYLGAAPEFSRVEVLTSDGDRTFDTWKQSISSVNLKLGLAIKL